MTDAELDEMVRDMSYTGGLSMLYRCRMADAITTLRAQLAAETARADRADAERAAQIEADAGIADHYADQDYCAMGYPEEGGIAASGTADMIRREIRAQPHDRTALKAAISAAKVAAWQQSQEIAKLHRLDTTALASLPMQSAAAVAIERAIAALIEKEGRE